AIRIYKGQLAFLKDPKSRRTVEHMADQEQKHFDKFDGILKQRNVRPTVFMPFWHVAGFALGAASAMLGEKAAFACTVAVESVIDEHYQDQRQRLSVSESELSQTIEQFRQEEMEHHDIAIAEGAEQTPLYPILSGAIKAASKAAIFLSTRF
ncbi:MAG: demethoxyubiquinone hydroxylase family protein, partial [Pseudomonadota bacterium]